MYSNVCIWICICFWLKLLHKVTLIPTHIQHYYIRFSMIRFSIHIIIICILLLFSIFSITISMHIYQKIWSYMVTWKTILKMIENVRLRIYNAINRWSKQAYLTNANNRWSKKLILICYMLR